MLFGNRRPRKSDARRRSIDPARSLGEQLEDRVLLAIDLGGTTPTANPLIATAPFGMDFAGTTSGLGAGWSVSDLGDVNGDGYDDFLVGGPTTTTPSTIGTGIGSAAYLIFGSNTVTSSTLTTAVSDWIGTNSSGAFNYSANNRVGDLNQIGQFSQTNPITSTALTLPFAGIKFVTAGVDLASGLGASVASVRMSNGTYGILIGAPNATDVNNTNTGTGRAYLITGNFNSYNGQTVNLDNPGNYPNLAITTFVNTATGGSLGYSVSGAYNLFGDGQFDVVLGAPNASFGTTGGTGVVYAVSLGLIGGGTTTQTINLANFSGGGSNVAILAGAASGSQAGWSVADAGDVNGVLSPTGSNIDDLVIGAPSQGGGGAAYLIYGGNLGNLAQSVTVNGATVRYINLANVGATGTGAVPGAAILGPSGSRTGQAVSSGGDFNGDGFSDVLIGSPQFSSTGLTSNGLATLLYGAPSSGTGYLTGTITLGATTSGVTPLYMIGPTSGSLTGYAVSPVGFINTGQPSSILIGAPGYNSNSGTAYLIPGRSGGLTGTQSLLGAETSPLSGVQFLLTTPNSATTSPPFFGASLSSRFQTTTVTADSDSRQDFIIGAPGYDATQSQHLLAGGAMIVQGGLITVQVPASNRITTTIGVGAPFGPFSINARTPANLQIYVFGTTTSSGVTFQPVRDIDPTTVVVNGVAYPNATLTPDTNQADWVNGIQDAIITITPRSALNLTNGAHVITITGSTLASSPLAGQTWTGSATASVTGGTGGGGGGGGASGSTAALPGLARGASTQTTFNSPFGATQYVPTISQLSAYNYAPIPLSVALQQYLPAPGFNERTYEFNHPGKHLRNYLTIRGPQATGFFLDGNGGPGYYGTYHHHNQRPIFVNNQILDRSRFTAGKSYTWTHTAPKIGSPYKGVVPVQLTTEHIAQVPGLKAESSRQIGHPHNGNGHGSYSAGRGSAGS